MLELTWNELKTIMYKEELNEMIQTHWFAMNNEEKLESTSVKLNVRKEIFALIKKVTSIDEKNKMHFEIQETIKNFIQKVKKREPITTQKIKLIQDNYKENMQLTINIQGNATDVILKTKQEKQQLPE